MLDMLVHRTKKDPQKQQKKGRMALLKKGEKEKRHAGKE